MGVPKWCATHRTHYWLGSGKSAWEPQVHQHKGALGPSKRTGCLGRACLQFAASPRQGASHTHSPPCMPAVHARCCKPAARHGYVCGPLPVLGGMHCTTALASQHACLCKRMGDVLMLVLLLRADEASAQLWCLHVRLLGKVWNRAGLPCARCGCGLDCRFHPCLGRPCKRFRKRAACQPACLLAHD